jgi:endonuclease-8
MDYFVTPIGVTSDPGNSSVVTFKSIFYHGAPRLGSSMPEGPSLVIVAEEARPLIGKKVLAVDGNSKQSIDRLAGKKILDIFSYGKTLNLQFDTFAVRIHFMLWGKWSIGEPKEGWKTRLGITTKRGGAYFYNCSVRFIESPDVKATYDLRTDIMAPEWNRALALRKIKALPDESVDDILMDQTIFTGVGNIIKNEVLWRQRLLPSHLVRDLTPRQLGKLVTDTRTYCFLFYEWKKQYVLKKHYVIYRKGGCPQCGGKVTRRKTGKRQRLSHFCPLCQH